jgi:hypothetical protein
MVVLRLFTEAWNCGRDPNAQSGGIHPKESQTVYSDFAEGIDTSLYGGSQYYQTSLPTRSAYPRG